LWNDPRMFTRKAIQRFRPVAERCTLWLTNNNAACRFCLPSRDHCQPVGPKRLVASVHMIVGKKCAGHDSS